MCTPEIIKGNSHTDQRGTINYNNLFNASAVKRIYIIENSCNKTFRGWVGHKVEQRWFSAVQGHFKIKLIKIDDWNNPSKNLNQIQINLEAKKLDVLHIPQGYISCIQAIENNSKLLVMADYSIDEINDEYRYDLDYFKTKF